MKVNILTPSDTEYPRQLARLHQPPQRLFVLGSKISNSPIVAIVGARKATAYGRETTYGLARDLACLGVTVISGLALGVDSAAHRGALEAGNTIAVLPGSVETVYPATNRQLGQQILDKNGSLVSEYPPYTDIRRHNFIERNRIIAGLAQAVVVVEAAERSGSLSTAQFALELGMPVLALPGPITSPTSVGTNRLIATGARIVLGIDDILEEIGLTRSIASSIQPRVENETEQRVLDAVGRGIQNNENLCELCQLEPLQLSAILTRLELLGVIRQVPGIGWIVRHTSMP